MQSIKSFFIKLLAGFLFLSALFFNGNLKDYYYRNHVGSNVVRILNKANMNSGGTGFHVKGGSGAVYILTNKHVCSIADKNDELIVERNGETMVRKILAVYDQHDLCLVEPMDETDGIDIASSSFRGEDVIVIGHPGLRQLTLSHGEFIGTETIDIADGSIKKDECKGEWKETPLAILFGGSDGICVEYFISSAISSVIYGGNSGSPVINKYGNLVGVVFAGNRTQPNDSYMVPLKHVKSFLKGL